MKKRIVAAVCAAFLLLPLLGMTAYAGGGDSYDQSGNPITPPLPEIPATEYPTEPEEKPFTPDGTATVIDNAMGEDGKEFFTIMTPAENVFYLVIDRQRGSENVYFLNAVTEADLMALAVISEKPAIEVVEPTPPAEPDPEPEPKKGGSGGMILVVLLLLGGGAGWYFKIYRPKHQQGDAADDLEYSEDEGEFYGEDDLFGDDYSNDYSGDSDDGTWEDDSNPADIPPWDEEE